MGIKNQDDILALIARNLAGLSDSHETVTLKEWVECSEGNRLFFEQVCNIWDLSDKKIDPTRINIEEALKKVQSRVLKVSPKRALWQYWQKVAAIIIIPLLIGTNLWVYRKSNKIITSKSNETVYNEVFAAFGTRTSLRLADSTLVWLNSGSSLRYPDKFNDKNRTVYLKGEAYFEVNKDEYKPFIVQTSTLQVKATGTKFNVQEYDSNQITEITLVSGKIYASELENEKNSQSIFELSPNQQLVYNRQTKSKFIYDIDSYRFIAWKDGKLIFRNEPLEEVLNKISMMFNVDIELQGDELRHYRYRATFQDESLEEILKLLKLSSPIAFREVKRVPLPDGSFPKKKVIIFPAHPTTHDNPN